MTELKALENEKKIICIAMARAKKEQKDLEIYLKMIQSVERDMEQMKEAA